MPAPTPASASQPPDAGATSAVERAKEPAQERAKPSGRVVAIGDLHGDIQATRAALRLAGAIDEKDRWVGGALTLVQTGDQLDRGDEEREILDLLERLAAEAQAAGGRLVALNGNHEVMNVQGDFRYVTPGAIGDFAGVQPASPHAAGISGPFADRAAAFLPGGKYARLMAARDVVAIVGDSVFAHGGVLPEHVSYGLDRINRETREWMASGERTAPESVAGESAPIWVRDYSLDPVPKASCDKLAQVLSALKVKRMVVGHTIQQRGINAACADRVYRIDVGLSRYYGQNPVQVLEIDGESVRVLSAAR